MNQKLKLNKGEITIDRMTGLAFRDGKVLGRKNWIVETETNIAIINEYIIKAISQEEAEEKAISMSERRYQGKHPHVEVITCWSQE